MAGDLATEWRDTVINVMNLAGISNQPTRTYMTNNWLLLVAPDNTQVKPSYIDIYLKDRVKPFLDSLSGSSICGMSEIVDSFYDAFDQMYYPIDSALNREAERIQAVFVAQGGYTSAVETAIDNCINDFKLIFKRAVDTLQMFLNMPATTEAEIIQKLKFLYYNLRVILMVSAQSDRGLNYFLL